MAISPLAGGVAAAVSSPITASPEAAKLLNAVNGLAAKGELTPELKNALNKILSQGSNQTSGAAIPSAHVVGAISAVSGAAGHVNSSGVGPAFASGSGATTAAGHVNSSGVGPAFASGSGATTAAGHVNSNGVGPAFASGSGATTAAGHVNSNGVGPAFASSSGATAAAGHVNSSGVGPAFASGSGATAGASAGVGQAFGAISASGAAGHVNSSGLAAAVAMSPLMAEKAAMAELAALKSSGAPPKIIAQFESKIENLKDLGAAVAVSRYAHDTGRHIKPNGSLDLAGIKGDYTASPAVRDAAARALHTEQMNAKDPVYVAHQTLQKYAQDTGRHILPDHRGMDLAGIKSDYTASPEVRKAASDLLASQSAG